VRETPNLDVLLSDPLQDGPNVLERQVTPTQVLNEVKRRRVPLDLFQNVLESRDPHLF
jgi:hypothetical protein